MPTREGGSEAVRLLPDYLGHASYTAVAKAVMPRTNAINILVQSVSRQWKVTMEEVTLTCCPHNRGNTIARPWTP